MKPEISFEWVNQELEAADGELSRSDRRALNLWRRLRVTPQEWNLQQYKGLGQAWVVATIGQQCLYFNEVEMGWGWGSFGSRGKIDSYHWEQFEIHHVVLQTLWAIDNEG